MPYAKIEYVALSEDGDDLHPPLLVRQVSLKLD